MRSSKCCAVRAVVKVEDVRGGGMGEGARAEVRLRAGEREREGGGGLMRWSGGEPAARVAGAADATKAWRPATGFIADNRC